MFFIAMNDEKIGSEEFTTQGTNKTPDRRGLYAKVAHHIPRAIEVLVDLMEHSHNESIRIGAAKALLDKGLPDLKAVQMGGEDGGPVEVRIVADERLANSELSQATGDL